MMHVEIKAAQAAAQAELCPNLADGPVELHKEYRLTSECGFNMEVNLRAHEVCDLAARLRGISAITAVFMATSGDSEAKLNQWMAGGLHDAIRVLTSDAERALEEAADRSATEGQPA